MIFLVKYVKKSEGWGGGVEGQLLRLQAESPEEAMDAYIQETSPAVWQANWHQKGLSFLSDYMERWDHLQCVPYEGPAERVKLTLLRGGKG